MSALTRGPEQTPIRESTCRDAIESALNLPGILDAGVALYGAQGAFRLDVAEPRDIQLQGDLSGHPTMPFEPRHWPMSAPGRHHVSRSRQAVYGPTPIIVPTEFEPPPGRVARRGQANAKQAQRPVPAHIAPA